MKIIRIPTFWTALWQEYHEDIQRMYDDIASLAREHTDNEFDDDVKF